MSIRQSIIEVIKKRRSCRTYRREPIDPALVNDIDVYLNRLPLPPFKTQPRFKLIESDAYRGRVRLGTYGMIKDAGWFITGAVSNHVDEMNKHLIDYGYLMEATILYVTGLGIGTCWLGGTFKRSGFNQTLELGNDEVIPAIVSLGYPAERRTLRERALRRFANADKRLGTDELFFFDNIGPPLTAGQAGRYWIPLQMLRLAPSASNRQPWRIIMDSIGLHLYLKRTEGYHKTLKAIDAVDLQMLDMGIAMCHFGLTAGEIGLYGGWTEMYRTVPHEGMEYIATWVDDPSQTVVGIS